MNQILRALTVLWGLCFVVLGLRVFIADSEIWSINLGVHFLQDFFKPWVTTRPLFHGLLWVVTSPFTDPDSIFLVSRALFVLIGALLVFFTFRFARREFQSERVGLWAALLLLLNLGFLNQGFRIRSDLLGSLIVLALASSSGPKRWWFWFAPLLATPKALAWSLLLTPRIRKLPRLDARVAIGITVLVLAILGLNAGNLSYFARSFTENWEDLWLDPSREFFYVLRLFERTPWFGVLIGVKLILALRHFARRKIARERWLFETRWLGLAILWALLLLLYPERLPYFLAAGLPFISIWLASIVRDLDEMDLKRPLLVGLGAGLLIWAQVLAGAFAWRNMSENSNEPQLEAIRRLEVYFHAVGDPLVYDVIGLNPRKNEIRYFLGPNQDRTNDSATNALREKKPEFVLAVRKLALAGKDMRDFLDSEYTPLGQGIYARNLGPDSARPPPPKLPADLADLFCFDVDF